MAVNKIPERLNDFRVYHDGSNDLQGIADITLPSFELMTETVSGAGIAGEYESPTLGHFQSMKLGLNFRSITEKQLSLLQQKAQRMDCRGALQEYDAATGNYSQKGVRVVVQGPTTKNELGKFQKSSPTDGSVEIEVLYLKITMDGKTKVEIDKLNYICIIDGVDYLAGVRNALGL